ncbi:FHA domain-containing protein [Chloroflexales bacterium ZM16-3]|nr:FHA domain-containing protein [Chloroflexales bacterium ZM16-3]
MSKRLQVYYSAVFGALGGLAGWWSVGSFVTQTWGIWPAAAFVGAGLGLCIGALVAAADGAMVKGKPLRAVRDGILGGLAGVAAGALGMLLAQGVFLALLGGWAGRALSWMLLGLLIGLGDLLVSRRPQRATYAALGGLVGGLAGGLLYEGLTQLFRAQAGVAQVALSGVGLVIIGACIGGLIPLARQVFARGELRVIVGEQAGLVREVTDSASIGRYDGNDLYLPDAGVAWRHAVVRRADSGFELAVLPNTDGLAQVGELAVEPGSSRPLRSGDRIRIGGAELEFVGR